MAAAKVAKSTYINLPSGFVERIISQVVHERIRLHVRAITIPDETAHQEIAAQVQAARNFERIHVDLENDTVMACRTIEILHVQTDA